MIIISQRLYKRLVEYAKGGAPKEVCGLIGGAANGEEREAREIYLLSNTADSETRFAMDPAEQFAAIRDMRGKGVSPIACFHSHPNGAAKPSRMDARLAYDEEISYLIVSLRSGADVKAFRVMNGAFMEEGIVVREIVN